MFWGKQSAPPAPANPAANDTASTPTHPALIGKPEGRRRASASDAAAPWHFLFSIAEHALQATVQRQRSHPMPEERKSEKLDLTSPPIVEVVVDIDCDLPTDFDLAGTEAAAVEGLADSYHWVGRRSTRAGKTTGGEGGVDSLNSDRLQFRSGDGKQVVQFRAGGFSFNRLAPYSSFDDYLPEIQRLWAIFVNISKPVGLRRIRLRTVNRIWLPIDAHSGVSLDKYIETGPKLPELPGRSPCLVGFFDQHQLFDASTGSDATIIITAQEAQENRLPLILDIDVYSNDVPDISEWAGIGSVLQSLRSLKNDIFKATLTPSCLSLFSDPPSVR